MQSRHKPYMEVIRIAAFAIFVGGCISATCAQDSDDSCEILHAIPASSESQFVDVTNNTDVEDLERYLAGQATPRFQSFATKKLELSEYEFQDLASRAKGYPFDNFEPKCNWVRHAMDRQHTVLKFTRPLFSTDGKLAIVGVSRLWIHNGGNGGLCIVRKSQAGWEAKCAATWIT